MRIFSNKIILLFLAVTTLGACSDTLHESPETGEKSAVRFLTVINSPLTRTSSGGDEWSSGDEVGIYMMMRGDDIADAVYGNYRYIADPGRAQSGESLLRPANRGDSSIYYPQSLSPLEFIAYYPYSPKVYGSSPVLPLNIGNQRNNAAIDILYASTSLRNYNSTAQVTLPFAHKMSKLRLMINLRPGVNISLAGAEASIDGIPATSELKLSTGSFRSLGDPSSVQLFNAGVPTKYENDSAYFQAILIPHEGQTYDDRKVLITVAGRSFTWDVPAQINFEEGKVYTYHITLSGDSKAPSVASSTGTIDPWALGDESAAEAGEDTGAKSGATSFVELPDGSLMETAYIRAGSFMMGSPSNEIDRVDSSETRHSVTLSHDYKMGKYEVTNEQYATFLNAMQIGSSGKGTDNNLWVQSNSIYTLVFSANQWTPVAGKSKHPASFVSWYGAKAYADWVGNGCRLPSEAEWEYACRAGSQTPFFFGVDSTDVADYACYKYSAGQYPAKTGVKKPNAWNLYDMCGNVFELCSDVYAADYEHSKTNNRSMRGGSYRTSSRTMRSAYRYYTQPDAMFLEIGFRVVFDVSKP
jgi:formylglycine-generating enzyme required for sulfatase activity